jgi:integral membrane protein
MTDRFKGAITRYRVMAIITGSVLLFNCVVSVPLQAAGHDAVGHVGWTVHGGLFIIYCLTVLDLGVRASWSLLRIVLVGLAGTIPVATFYAERKVTRSFTERAISTDGPAAQPDHTGSPT